MYITKAQLQRIEDSNPQYVCERRLFNAASADSTIFLSHKHQEKNILFQVKALFEKLGMKVYVDWMKGNMQHPTDAATAKELKKLEREKLKAEKQTAREARWAELDRKDAEKAEAKAEKKAEKSSKEISLADARGRIARAIENPNVMTELMKGLSASSAPMRLPLTVMNFPSLPRIMMPVRSASGRSR